MARPRDLQLCSCPDPRRIIGMTYDAAPAPAPTDATVDQAVAWNGPEGASWADHSSRRPADGDLVAPLLDAADLRPGIRVLDVGCGTGDLTRRAADHVGPGAATGIDLSTAMVEQARKASREGVRYVVGDAQVHAFEAGSFDRVLSHFGIMFFADPVAAFANLARALAPGGRLLFVCPQTMERCDWYRVPLGALLGREPSSADAPSVMFSLANPHVIRSTLTAAGLDDVRITPIDASLWFGFTPAQAAEAFLGSGPVRAFLERTPTVPPEAARELLEAAVVPFTGLNGVRIPGAHWLVDARASGDER
jgi:SAM-dependent methyltransferase